jgi:hypothetical protein
MQATAHGRDFRHPHPPATSVVTRPSAACSSAILVPSGSRPGLRPGASSTAASPGAHRCPSGLPARRLIKNRPGDTARPASPPAAEASPLRNAARLNGSAADRPHWPARLDRCQAAEPRRTEGRDSCQHRSRRESPSRARQRTLGPCVVKAERPQRRAACTYAPGRRVQDRDRARPHGSHPLQHVSETRVRARRVTTVPDTTACRTCSLSFMRWKLRVSEQGYGAVTASAAGAVGVSAL